MERDAIEALVARWAQAIVDGDDDALDALIDPDVRDLSGLAETRGSASFKSRARAVREAFAERSMSVDGLVVDGDSIAWRWTITATHAGPILGVALTLKRVNLRGVNFQRLSRGRVVEHWTLADWSGLASQLR